MFYDFEKAIDVTFGPLDFKMIPMSPRKLGVIAIVWFQIEIKTGEKLCAEMKLEPSNTPSRTWMRFVGIDHGREVIIEELLCEEEIRGILEDLKAVYDIYMTEVANEN